MTAPEKIKPATMPPEEIYGAFGRRVKEERKRRDITQEQLAEYVNVSDDTIEKGQSVKLDVAFNIALVLHIPVQLLLPKQDGVDDLCPFYRNSTKM